MGSEFGVCVCVCVREITWGGGIARAGLRRAQSAHIVITWCKILPSLLMQTHTHTQTQAKGGTLCARPTNLQARESVLLHPPLLNRGQPLEDNCGGLLMFSMIKLRRSSQGSRQFLYFMSQPQPPALVPHESGPNTENKMNDGFNYCP